MAYKIIPKYIKKILYKTVNCSVSLYKKIVILIFQYTYTDVKYKWKGENEILF